MAMSQESNTGGVQTPSSALSQPSSSFCAGFCGFRAAGSQRLSLNGSLKPGFAFLTDQTPLPPSPPNIPLKIPNFSFPNVSLRPTLRTPLKIQLISAESVDPQYALRPQCADPQPPLHPCHYRLFCCDFNSLLFLLFSPSPPPHPLPAEIGFTLD